jgi:hypothetical protein
MAGRDGGQLAAYFVISVNDRNWCRALLAFADASGGDQWQWQMNLYR